VLGLTEMDCQNCFRRATVHITEVVPSGAFEVHFCEEHANEYVASKADVTCADRPSHARRARPSKRLMRYGRRRFFTE
jgi:protein-arginine kinase activator protein McsA